jgi:hypothetical protein
MKNETGTMDTLSTDPRDIRKFGIVALVFFGSLCAIGIWKQKLILMCLFGFLAFLGTCFILFPSKTGPLYLGWMKFAHFMGRVVTGLMLTVAYILVITPAAWLKRLFGGRPLPVKPDTGASTYWVERQETAQPKERFLKRY